ncbi:hypothetical protein J6590_066055 [Homalodisca vitripennis]|nr:hypothetical protein J6590_066055 [Homalodisca vitripennis]
MKGITPAVLVSVNLWAKGSQLIIFLKKIFNQQLKVREDVVDELAKVQARTIKYPRRHVYDQLHPGPHRGGDRGVKGRTEPDRYAEW